ncbi:MAG TPA: enolase, partial [Reyranella sp.]|nr:enolase [Reyranella sp.]
REQLAFATAHHDLYEKKDGRPARLKAVGGKLALRSLDVPGFAVGAEMDFKSMTPMAEGAST